jgi:hypothetical protein
MREATYRCASVLAATSYYVDSRRRASGRTGAANARERHAKRRGRRKRLSLYYGHGPSAHAPRRPIRRCRAVRADPEIAVRSDGF